MYLGTNLLFSDVTEKYEFAWQHICIVVFLVYLLYINLIKKNPEFCTLYSYENKWIYLEVTHIFPFRDVNFIFSLDRVRLKALENELIRDIGEYL